MERSSEKAQFSFSDDLLSCFLNQTPLKRFADFHAAGCVFRRGKLRGHGLGGLEIRRLHHGLGGFFAQCVRHVLPAVCQIGIGGDLEAVAQFVDEVGAVADEDDIAACRERGVCAFLDSAPIARPFQGEIV